MRKMILALVVAAALLAALAVPLLGGGQAFAAPTVRNPEATVLTATCEDGIVYVVVGTPGAASFDSTGVGVTMILEARVYVNDEPEPRFTRSFNHGRGLDNLLKCSFDERFVDPDTGFRIRIEGTSEVLQIPRRVN